MADLTTEQIRAGLTACEAAEIFWKQLGYLPGDFCLEARTLLPAALTELLRLRTALADKEREWREEAADLVEECECGLISGARRAVLERQVRTLRQAADELAAMKGGDRE